MSSIHNSHDDSPTPESQPQRLTSVRRLLRLTGIDRAIGYTILLQIFSIASRPLILLLMVRYLSPIEQGYQYTILAILGIKSLFDAGLGITLTHFVSREAGRLTVSTRNGIVGDPRALARVASLYQLTVQYYIVISVCFVAITLPAGWYLLASSEAAHGWQSAWVIAILVTAIGFPIDCAMNILVACGQLVPILRIRLVIVLTQTLSYGLMLIAGLGLLAAPLSNAIALIVQLLVLIFVYRRIFLALWRYSCGEHRIHWIREVFPFQWRVALVWLSNYFLSQAIIPILFHAQGGIEAGRLGLSMALIGIVQSFAVSWVTVRLPRYGAMLGRGEIAECNRQYRRDVLKAVFVFWIGAILVIGSLVALDAFKLLHDYSQRILPLAHLLVIAVTAFCWMIVDCMTGYFNVHHREPLVIPRVIASVLIVTCAAILAQYYDTLTILSAIAIFPIIPMWIGFILLRKFTPSTPSDE